MQKLFTLLVLMSISYLGAAQNISQSQMAMNDGIHNAYTLSVPENVKFTKSVWRTYMQSFGRVKKNKQKEYASLGASISGLSSRPIDIFAKFEKLGKHETLMHVWFKKEEGYFSAEDSVANDKATVFLEEFKKEVERTIVRTELKKAEKVFKKKDSDLSRLIKKNERLHKDIENYNKKIQKATENIAKNETEQAKTKDDLEKQKETVNEIKGRLNEI